jgi:type IV pilus assembly protein PilC
LDSLKITSDSVGNVIYRKEVLKMAGDIREGGSLSESLDKSLLFPSVASQMVKVGEQTGELDSMLDSLANYYEEEVDNAIKGLSTLIEPVIIVFMGLVVGAILMAIMTPIYNISQVIFKK